MSWSYERKIQMKDNMLIAKICFHCILYGVRNDICKKEIDLHSIVHDHLVLRLGIQLTLAPY